MRRFAVIAVFAVFAPALFATSVFAQAPIPKVTISGLFDQVTSMGRNFYDGNFARNSDQEWYARTRFRPDFEFAVGRVKAVLGLELDLMYGQAGANDGGFPTNNSGLPGGASPLAPINGTKVNTNGALDINTDVGGMIEIKWIYTEFPLTGQDSLLPFIPVETMARAGGQPFGTIATYKLAAFAASDFAGLSTVTTFAPNIRLNLGYVIAEDQLAGANRGLPSTKTGRGEDYALIVSPEYTPLKGLDLKPLYSWFHADGVTSIASRRNLVNVRTVGGVLGNGTSMAPPAGPPAAGSPSYHEDRHTIGIDTRWRLGAFGLDPTIMYQWGRMDSQAFDDGPGAPGTTSKKVTADLNAILVDIIGSYQLGPVLLEARWNYATGNKARDNLAKGIRYFQPLSTDGIYYAGWAQIMALGVDYFNGVSMGEMGRYMGYDRYGRNQFGVRATYTVMPPLSFYAVVSPTWTAEKVDTDTNSTLLPGAVGLTGARTTVSANSWVKGDAYYIGTEANLGMTWRFSANAAFDLVGGYLFAGDALDTAECINGTAPPCSAANTRKKSAQDAYTAAARVRLAF
jgi:hypothetical protein